MNIEEGLKDALSSNGAKNGITGVVMPIQDGPQPIVLPSFETVKHEIDFSDGMAMTISRVLNIGSEEARTLLMREGDL